LKTEGASIRESLVSVRLEPLHQVHAVAVTTLRTAQREFLAPFEPARGADFYTLAAQRRAIAQLEAEREADRGYGFLILANEEPAGMLSVSRVTRGPFQNAGLGYWVAEQLGGRGIATAAVGEVVEWGFSAAGLHRLEAATLTDNAASQIVLRRNRFTEIGFCPRYLHIAGEWRDHLLFARTVED
jgi:[ribosomal protein S5]-alanine N-acetyltransferase